MEGKPKKTKFEKFLDERSGIVDDIRLFLGAVLSFCENTERVYHLHPEQIAEAGYARSLVHSLCLIHSFYGYPTKSNIGDAGKKSMLSTHMYCNLLT